ncbi:MAG: metallophosphoesterase [Candidatus Njordarchaeia archaeon]
MNKIHYEEIMLLIDSVRRKIKSLQSVVNVEGEEIYFVGDIHGDLRSFNEIKKILLSMSPKQKIVFLGDYVDRGGYSLEVVTELFRLFLEKSDQIILLRGNHESYPTNYFYGFYDELRKRFGDKGESLYDAFNDLFSYLPIAAMVNDEVLALHGGIPNTTVDINDLNKVPRGERELVDPTLLQVLWNDPSEEIRDWMPSPRGDGIYLFGEEPFNKFMEENGLKFLIRAHSFLLKGYKYFFDKKLLSLFSPLDYVGYEVEGKIAKLKGQEIEIISIKKS